MKTRYLYLRSEYLYLYLRLVYLYLKAEYLIHLCYLSLRMSLVLGH